MEGARGKFGANARGLGSSQRAAEAKAAPAARAANNAAARRVRAFRAGLARGVAALHAAWLARRAAAAASGEAPSAVQGVQSDCQGLAVLAVLVLHGACAAHACAVAAPRAGTARCSGRVRWGITRSLGTHGQGSEGCALCLYAPGWSGVMCGFAERCCLLWCSVCT